MTTREQLIALLARVTGTPKQSEALKSAARMARGALKSTLASERELGEHIDRISNLL